MSITERNAPDCSFLALWGGMCPHCLLQAPVMVKNNNIHVYFQEQKEFWRMSGLIISFPPLLFLTSSRPR